MKFLVVLLIIAFAATALAQVEVCPSITCVKAASPCNVNLLGNPRIECRGDSYCNVSNPTLQTGVCFIPRKVGESCQNAVSGNFRCADGLTCTGISSGNGNATCALKEPTYNYLHPGESCSGDLQCARNTPDPGTDGSKDLCKSGHCKSVSDGGYCELQLTSNPTSSDQCHYGRSYCSNAHRCEKYIKKGGFCSTTDQTQYGCGKPDEKTCMPTFAYGPEGTCQDFNSRKVGEICRDIYDCEEGLFCLQPDFSSGARGSCVAPTALINRPCVSSADCTQNNAEECVCTTASTATKYCRSSVFPKGYFNAKRAYERCDRTKGCNGVFGCSQAGACKSKFCSYADHALKRDRAGGRPSCQYEGVCNSAFALVASPLLAFFAFVALFAL